MTSTVGQASLLLSDGIVGLRRPDPVDAPHYARMRNDLTLVSAVMGFRLGVSDHRIDEWIASGGGVTGDDLLFTAVLVADRRPVGYVKLYRVDRFSRHAWVGLSLFDTADAGKGIGRRILTQMCDYAHDFLGIRKISLEVVATNDRALGLYRDLGFAEEGRLRSQFYAGGQFEDVVILSRFFVSDGPSA